MSRRSFCLLAAIALAAFHFGPRFLPDVVAGQTKVLIVHEAQEAAKLPADQQLILFDGRLKDAIESTGGQLRIIDKDAANQPAEWKPLWDRDRSKLPKWVIARGNRITVDEPLPATVEAAISRVK